MPELPDVQVLREYVDATSLHKRIEDVDVISDYILKDVSSSGLSSGLRNHQFKSTERHGKFLFILLEYGRFLVLHFGMSGSLKYYKLEDNVVLPDYSQVHFDFENGYRLSLIMPRKLGEVRLLDDMQSFIKQRGLGPDVSADDFTFEKFKDLLAGRRGMIKSTLMNQEIMAGVGNVYSDEILFQARVHPKAKVNELDRSTLRRIFDCLKDVLNTLVETHMERDQLPRNYLLPVREEGEKCPYCHGEVKNIKVSGRSAYYCPACQQMPD